MSTIALVLETDEKDPLMQGDIFRDVRYLHHFDEKDNDDVVITEYIFPHIIILSQSCDISAMSNFIEKKGGKLNKFMLSVLVTPIYEMKSCKTFMHLDDLTIKEGFDIDHSYLYYSNDEKVIDNDLHYRFHKLELKIGDELLFSDSILDFKHYFTLSVEYLNSIRNQRICRLKPIFCEQITLKFASYLARVAIP